MSELLTGEEEVVYGDSGYLGAEKREEAIVKNRSGKIIKYKLNRRPSQSKDNSVRSKAQIKRRERGVHFLIIHKISNKPQDLLIKILAVLRLCYFTVLILVPLP